MMPRSLVIAVLLALACDRATQETPPPVAATPAPAVPVAPTSAVAADPLLHIEAMTRTLWRVEEPVLTEVALELLAGAVVCTPKEGGCTLDVVAEGSVLRRLGIEPGDHVRTIGGVAVGDGASLQQAIHGARAQGIFTVELQRGAEARAHRYRIRTLAPRSKGADDAQRGADLLAEAIQREDGRVVIDIGALELLGPALDADELAGARLLGLAPGERITAIAEVPIGSNREIANVLSQLSDLPRELSVTTSGNEGAPRTFVLDTRAELVDPALLTAARASLSPVGRRDRLSTPETMEPRGAPFSGITAVSDTEYTIQKQTLELLLAAPMTFARAARIVPSADGGGLKLYGIRAGRADRFSFAHFGIKNGDVVTSINGHRIGEPEAALDAYAKLRTAKVLTVELTRDDKPLTLTIRIVD